MKISLVRCAVSCSSTKSGICHSKQTSFVILKYNMFNKCWKNDFFGFVQARIMAPSHPDAHYNEDRNKGIYVMKMMKMYKLKSPT